MKEEAQESGLAQASNPNFMHINLKDTQTP
jgi:hypothetical protein